MPCVGKFDSNGSYHFDRKMASGKSKWLAKIRFSIVLPDGNEVVEEDSLRTSECCLLVDFLPLVQESIDGMLEGFDETCQSKSFCSIWKL